MLGFACLTSQASVLRSDFKSECDRGVCHNTSDVRVYPTTGMKSVAFALVFLAIQGASSLRCYDCSPGSNSTTAGSAVICSKPGQIKECSSGFNSCSIIKITSDELDMYLLQCFLKSLCSEAERNRFCETITPQGLHGASCEMSCCQTDLCNKPKDSLASPTGGTDLFSPKGGTSSHVPAMPPHLFFRV